MQDQNQTNPLVQLITERLELVALSSQINSNPINAIVAEACMLQVKLEALIALFDQRERAAGVAQPFHSAVALHIEAAAEKALKNTRDIKEAILKSKQD